MGELTWNKYKPSQNIAQDKFNSKSDLSLRGKQNKTKEKKGCFLLSFEQYPAIWKHHHIAAGTAALWMCVLVKSQRVAEREDARCRGCFPGGCPERGGGAPAATWKCPVRLAAPTCRPSPPHHHLLWWPWLKRAGTRKTALENVTRISAPFDAGLWRAEQKCEQGGFVCLPGT